MANFVAITPPLGQQPWGAIPILLPALNTNANPVNANANANTNAVVVVPANISAEDFGYPPLNSYFRALILSKHPGSIFPDPKLENVFPCPDLNPIHIRELWTKYDEALEDSETYFTNLAAFIEHELPIWCAEFDVSLRAVIIAAGGPDMMDIDMAKSKKRARRETSENNDTMKAFAPKKTKVGKISSKKGKKPAYIAVQVSALKSQYDGAFPTDAVVDQNVPVYLMAKNYIELYSKSEEKYAERVREIIFKQGMEHLTQRCAKFFAWGMHKAIHSPTPTTSTQTKAKEVFEHWEHHADGEMRARETSENSDPFPDYVEPDPSEYEGIMDDIYNYGADGSVGGTSDNESDEIINFRPTNLRPLFRFERSSITSKLPEFLAEFKTANEELLASGASGSFELNDSDEEHIEMELGLGVLEEECAEENDEAKKTVMIEEL